MSARRWLGLTSSVLFSSGSSTYVRSGSNVGISGNTACTMFAFFRPTAATANQVICSMGASTGTNTGVSLRALSDTAIDLNITGIGSVPGSGLSSLGSKWSSIGFVKFSGAGSYFLYYNGVSINGSGAITPDFTDAIFRVGEDQNGANRFTGDICFAGIWNTAFSGAQMLAMHNTFTVPSASRVLYYLSEGSGTTATDSSGNGNNGTINAGTWDASQVPYGVRSATTTRFIRRNVPYSVKGVASSTSGITIPNNVALNPTAAVTVACWFFVDEFNSSSNALFDNSEAGVTNSYFFDYNQANGFRWFSVIGGTARNITSTATKITPNTWNFATATYTGSAVYFYVNGVKLAEEITGISGTLGTNPNQLCIMRAASGSAALCSIGKMYRPLIFNVGCTLAEHQDMYYRNTFSAALTAGKVLDLAMTEGSGSTIADVSVTGATATIGAAGSWSSDYAPFRSASAVTTRTQLT